MREGDEQPADAADGEDAGQSLGEMLRAGRATQELTLEEVAAELRIEERMLRALEEHRFDVLGAPVFAKGYLKQYAHRLKLSYDDLLVEYYRIADPRDVTIAPSRVIKLRDERQITIWAVAGVVIALLAVLLFLWWTSQPTTTFEPELTQPLDEFGDDPLDLDPLLPLPEPSDPGAVTEPFPVPEPTEDSALPSPNEVVVPTPQAVAEVAADDVAPSGPTLRLVLEFRQDSWVEVVDNEGRRLFYGLGRAGARSGLVGVPPIDVLLGNVGGVGIEVDGQPFTVPGAARQGNLARFTLDLPD
jgi:cytoskeleton protein RodZ